MNQKIKHPIPKRNFEMIRESVGRVLFEEFDNQAALQNEDFYKVIVYDNRKIPFDASELDVPNINIRFIGGETISKDYRNKTMAYKYAIDVYVKAINGSDNVLSLREKIMGMADYILEHPNLKILDLVNPVGIISSIVEALQVPDFTDDINVEEISMGRLLYSIKIDEACVLDQGVEFELLDSKVILGVTDKGYRYENKV